MSSVVNHPADAVALDTPIVEACGQIYVKIDGQWCAQTQAATWRPAKWLRGTTIDGLLDHIHEATTQESV